MLDAAGRTNPRMISNLVSTQAASTPSPRGLSDYLWAWGQLLDHDLGLSHADASNGFAPIVVIEPSDPLYGGMIPFSRSDYVMAPDPMLPGDPPMMVRQQTNSITSYIDASQVYGSDPVRAAALRTDGGNGAKLKTSAADLLPYNVDGLPNDGIGMLPENQMFLAGDVRANENLMLTSMHTVLLREHNRLVDRIASVSPSLDAEAQYQLARKLVGAEIQAITYNEFLPALLGGAAPTAADYAYDANVSAQLTQSFAHAAYRFGHSMVSGELKLLDPDDGAATTLQLRDAFFRPNLISADPEMIDHLLAGAARSYSEALDLQVIDDLRTFLFGPPGAGGMDLAALNIQRGRDHGLPDYNELRVYFGLTPLASFTELTSDAALAGQLAAAYGGDIDNVDPWVGLLAEDPLPGASTGELLTEIIADQFTRSRDGDRLFYLSGDAGLYVDGVLDPTIREIVDLDAFGLSDLLLANTSLSSLQQNVFFVVPEPTAAVLLAAALAVAFRCQRPAR